MNTPPPEKSRNTVGGGRQPGGAVLSPRPSFFFRSEPMMANRAHLVSVNRTIAAAGLVETGEDAAVVSVARNLARRMDALGDAAPLGLLRSFQSAVKDLQRAAARKVPAKPARDVPEIDPGDESEDALTQFLRKWKVGV